MPRVITMLSQLPNAPSLVWLLLSGATCVSLAVGSGSNHVVGSIGVIAIAIFKMRLILLHFMEMAHAPWVWRGVFELILLVTGAAMCVMYLRWLL
jgi:hypothetical protein